MADKGPSVGRYLAGWINKTLAQYNPGVMIDTDLVVPEVPKPRLG